MTKEEAYEKATMISIGENPNGTRQDVVYKAMEIYTKQESIAFGEFISNHRLNFQTANNGSWIGLDMKRITNEELYELYLKDKNK